MILEEIVQEIVADDLPAGAALIAQCLGNVIQVCFQRVRTVHHLQPVAQAGNDVVLQILLVGNGDHVVHIREVAAVFAAVPFAACIGQSFHIQRVAAKHTAHGIAEQALDIPLQVGFAHGHILILHFRGQFILQAVNINKNAVQLFLVGFQLFKALLALALPQQIANFQRAACFRQVAIKVVHSSSRTGSIP